MFPIEIKFRNMPSSDFVYNNIFENSEKLGRFFDRITSCQVVVSAPHKKHNKGKIYHIWIHLNVPGRTIVVNRASDLDSSHEDIYIAIRDAFEAATRQLEDYVRRRRGAKKYHPWQIEKEKNSVRSLGNELKDMEMSRELLDVRSFR
ncbi:MAG: hypothetical protein A4S09_03195 [Proteobacteria bacterium SG_bin7]|nr:MAG: hypothetical protein A4S09_03195 [Proteobacteria bacterium SG_bin7]